MPVKNERIAEPLKRCLVDEKFVGIEVKHYLAPFSKVWYCFEPE